MRTQTFNVFTYGSLMYPQVWQRVVLGEYPWAEATVHGFRRLCVRDESHPVLVVSKGASMLLGRLYYGVSTADVQRLDAFETDAYARVAIAVTANGATVAADAYLGRHCADLIDADWSPDIFERTGMRSFLVNYVQAHISLDDTRS